MYECVSGALGSLGYTIMGNAAGSMEVPLGKEGKTVSAPPVSTGPQKPTAGPKLPVPPEEELEERFNAVLVSWTHTHTHTYAHAGHISMWGRHAYTFTLKKPRKYKETKNLLHAGKVHVLRSELITVPGTQRHREKIHKSSFMLRLTAALGSVHALLKEEEKRESTYRCNITLHFHNRFRSDKTDLPHNQSKCYCSLSCSKCTLTVSTFCRF